VPVTELLGIQLNLERTRFSYDDTLSLSRLADGSDPTTEARNTFRSSYRHVALIYLYRVP
jgi:hypothetical protein